MSLLDLAGRLIARPTPSLKVQQVMSRVSNPGPGNLLPTYIIESGVISGRSAFAWKRNGFLEFQERFVEEASVAAVWFWGVRWMGKLFDWTVKQVSSKPLDTSIGWSLFPSKLEKQTLALTPLERYTPSAKVAESVLKLKGVHLAFSVLTSVGILAWAIPWMNQKKTEWIIKNFYQSNANTPQFGAHSSSGLKPSVTQTPKSLSFERPALFQAFQVREELGNATRFGANPSEQSQTLSQEQKPLRHAIPLQFGGLLGERGLNTLGHWIQDTDLGSLFVLDTGILSGRTYNASKRSKFEAGEVLLRDLASYYFYFFAVPNVMSAVQAVSGKLLGSQIHLEPLIAETITPKLEQWLKAHSGESSQASFLRETLLGKGIDKSHFQDLVKSLSEPLLNAPKAKFLAHLEKELALIPEVSADKILPLFSKESESLSAQRVFETLESLQKQAQPWSQQTRRDVQRAIKLAYQGATGVSVEGLKNRLAAHQVVSSEMLARMQQMAEEDTLNRLNVTVRRLLHLNPEPKTAEAALHPAGEALTKQLESAEMKSLSLSALPGEFQPDRLKAWVSQWVEALPTSESKSLGKHLESQISRWLSNPEVFALDISPEGVLLTEKLETLLKGGLIRNNPFLKEGMNLLGVLPESAKEYAHPDKMRRLQQNLTHYLEAFLEKLSTSKTKTSEEVLSLWKNHVGLSRNLRYVSNIAGIAFGIWGLSYLIPKVQYAVTAKLTGRNEHPGIAAVLKKH
jgi:hypothetical protein